jgi:hypothetical protein
MDETPLHVWLLAAGSDKEYVYLQGYIRDHAYWERYFHAESMPEDWELPPLEILGKSKKLGDCVGWMLQAPIVSERARTVLEPIVGADVQFVRFHDLRGKPYYGMNVLRVERDYLDVERSKCNRRPDGDIVVCMQYVFRASLSSELPAIFKIHPESGVFVTRRFAEAIVEHKLTGFCLQDPGQNAFALMGKGLPLNAYPGLL